MKDSKKILKRVRYHFSKLQADDWLSVFSKAELRFPIIFEVQPELEILMWLSLKSPDHKSKPEL